SSQYWRTNLMTLSFASEPPDAKKTWPRSPGRTLATTSASCCAGGASNRIACRYGSVPACSHRVDDLAGAVAESGHADPRRRVQVAPSLVVDQLHAFPADEHRGLRAQVRADQVRRDVHGHRVASSIWLRRGLSVDRQLDPVRVEAHEPGDPLSLRDRVLVAPHQVLVRLAAHLRRPVRRLALEGAGRRRVRRLEQVGAYVFS